MLRRLFFLIIYTTILPFNSGCTSSEPKLNVAAPIEFSNVQPMVNSEEKITFHIATDTHYLSEKINDHGEAFQEFLTETDGKLTEYIDPILQAFTAQTMKEQPDVLVISGDLTNNGEKASHVDMAAMLQQIEDSGIHVYVIPGNHDILNPWAVEFKEDKLHKTEAIEPEDFSKIYDNFGYNEAISQDPHSLSYLAAPSEDIWLLMIDSNKYENNHRHPEMGGIVSENTLDWIEKSLSYAKEQNATVIPVMHHNLIDHNDMFEKNFTIDNNEQLINVFQEYQLQLAFSGHLHAQDISSYQNAKGTIYDIATGSLAVFPNQYSVLTYSAIESTLDYSTAEVDVEKWTAEQTIKDRNLNNFNSYAENFFNEVAYGMALKNLVNEDGLTTDEIDKMSRTMQIVSKNFFSGTEYLNNNNVLNSDGFQLLKSLPDEVHEKRFAESIVVDNDMEDNRLSIIINK